VKSRDTLLSVKTLPVRTAFSADIDLQSKAADAKLLLGGLWGFDFASGAIDLSLLASASGNTPAALVSTLKGKVTVDAGKLKLANTDVVARAAAPGEGWSTGTSDIGISLEADITEGIATLGKADLVLPAGTTNLKGEIDLLRQAFDLKVVPKGKVKSIRGTWTRPLFAADAGVAPDIRPISAPAN
jgi:hypothetical protein